MMNGAKSIWADKLPLRQRIGRYPALFYPLHAIKNRFSCNHLYTGRDTDIVIEGFPRSGNTFALFAFEQAQQLEFKIANHVHVPAQIARGVDYGIPTIVLLRNPCDAILSLIVRYPELSAVACAKTYVDFYRAIHKYRHGFMVANFSDVISDFGSVIGRVNARFCTKFSIFEHSRENVSKVFGDLDRLIESRGATLNQLSRPSDLKNRAKVGKRVLLQDIRAKPFLDEAIEWFNRFESISARSET